MIKLIGGIPHEQVRCCSCGEMVWTQCPDGRSVRQEPYMCRTCAPVGPSRADDGGGVTGDFNRGCGGGRHINRKEERQS